MVDPRDRLGGALLAAGDLMAAELDKAEARIAELEALVRKAVDAGLEVEAAYVDGFERFHNINDWEVAEHDRVQAARNALGACLNELAVLTGSGGT